MPDTSGGVQEKSANCRKELVLHMIPRTRYRKNIKWRERENCEVLVLSIATCVGGFNSGLEGERRSVPCIRTCLSVQRATMWSRARE